MTIPTAPRYIHTVRGHRLPPRPLHEESRPVNSKIRLLAALTYVLLLAIIALGVPLAYQPERAGQRGGANPGRRRRPIWSPRRPPTSSSQPRKSGAGHAGSARPPASIRGRVLVVNARGTVLADSAVPPQVGVSYQSRPEILTALQGRQVQVLRLGILQAGDYVPLGFNAWTNTWLWRFRDVYLTQWKVGDKEIPIDDIPASTFDSAEERDRVAGLLDQYNDSLTIDPGIDHEFAEIARERTARHPLRTFIEVPVLRAASMWLTPRTELLPYSGHLFPVREKWEDDPRDFKVTVGLALAGYFYVALGILGAWFARKQAGWALLIVFIFVRTAFFCVFVETPEPRYMLECFPALIALGAQVFARRTQLSSTGSG